MQNRLLIAIILSMLILVIFQKIEYQKKGNYIANEIKTDIIDKSEINKSPVVQQFKEEYKKNITKYDTASITNGIINVNINSIGAGISSFYIRDEKEGLLNLVRKDSPPFSLGLKYTEDKEWKLIKIKENELKATVEINGIEIIRRFKVEDNYLVIHNNVINKSGKNTTIYLNQGWYNGVGTTSDLEKENLADNRPFAKIGERIRTKIDSGEYNGKINWAGIVNRYFFTVFTNIDNSVFQELQVIKGKGGAGCRVGTTGGLFPVIELKGSMDLSAGEKRDFRQEIYGGVKEYAKLKKIDNDLDKILSFGIFGFLSRLFLNALIVFNSFLGNYGAAIILLTVVLQIFLAPLTVKSFKSMQSMKVMQPKINNLREKFKDDPQRMNQEMLTIYKKYKINPFSGCLPLLMQMPIFISLFTMLRNATELRYAAFLWISDLSKADVLFSTLPVIKNIPFIGGGGPLPFLMGGAMLLQQQFTGGMEGPQKSLTYMMPIMFTFLFMKFPSGLVLYWLANSIMTFFVQYTISRKQT